MKQLMLEGAQLYFMLLVDRVRVPLKGPNGLELNIGTVFTAVWVCDEVEALHMSDQITFFLEVFLTHTTFPVFSTSRILLTDGLLLNI
jgi:hypothetical protein